MKILRQLQNINGIGLVNFSIEPHFNINNKEVLEELKMYSKNLKIYALEDNAYIIMKDKQMKFYGNIYKIEDEEVIKMS